MREKDALCLVVLGAVAAFCGYLIQLVTLKQSYESPRSDSIVLYDNDLSLCEHLSFREKTRFFFLNFGHAVICCKKSFSLKQIFSHDIRKYRF